MIDVGTRPASLDKAAELYRDLRMIAKHVHAYCLGTAVFQKTCSCNAVSDFAVKIRRSC